MKRLLFIINPKAGRTAIRNDLFEIIMVFSQAGYEVVTYPTQDRRMQNARCVSTAKITI